MTADARHRRTARAALAAATALLLLPIVLLSPAGAQQSFVVTVNAEATYSRGPNWDYAFSPPLPPGYTVDGEAQCSRVVVDGAVLAIATVSTTLQSGDYALFDCRISAGNPLDVVDENGYSVPFTVTAGRYRVTPAPTELAVDVSPDGAGQLVFTVVVADTTNEETTVVGAPVVFAYEQSNGFYRLDACTAVTEVLDPTAVFPFAAGECSVPAAELLAGTGQWTATYAGSRNYGGAAASGRVDEAQADPLQAALALADALEAGRVQIVADYQAPGCYIDPGPNATLFLISVSVVSQDCTALKALQITTDVVTSLTPTGGLGAAFGFIKIANKARYARAAKQVMAWTLQAAK